MNFSRLTTHLSNILLEVFNQEIDAAFVDLSANEHI
jgi:hypothetical protein